MPVYAGATAPVYPIGLDMDWNSNAVAYGYSYCGFACQSLYRGYWLTFSDNQGAYPSDPQGASDAFNPTFYKTRVVSSDSGGNIFVQPDVPEAPFTSSYQGWLTTARASTSPAPRSRPPTTRSRSSWVKDGGAAGHHGRPALGHRAERPRRRLRPPDRRQGSGNATFSPDGSQMAWNDDEGVKVAGVPNMAAGTDTCTLTAPAHVIAPAGHAPSFGGADVAAVAGGVGGGAGAGQSGGGGGRARPRRPAGRRRSRSASPARRRAPRSPRA